MLPVPENFGTVIDDNEEIVKRNKEIFWKIKGVAAKASYRIFIKYNNPMKTDKPDLKTFIESFVSTHSIPLLESHLQILLSRKTNFVGAKVLNYANKFVAAATKRENTMEKLKPFIENLLYDITIPVL